MTTVLARYAYISLDEFGRATGLHPELVTRLVGLGLIEAMGSPVGGHPVFAPSELARVARMQRLRDGFGLNYAALGLVLDLLDRIDLLETALQHRRPPSGGGPNYPWTPTA